MSCSMTEIQHSADHMTNKTKSLEVFERGLTDLLPFCYIGGVHRAGADLTFLILEKQHAGLKLWVLIISIKDVDGNADAGIVALCCVHFLCKRT